MKQQIRPLGPIHLFLFPLLMMLARGEKRESLARRRDYTKKQAERRAEVKLLKQELEKEAKLYSKIIVDCWTGLSFAWFANAAHIATEGKVPHKGKMQRVKFDRVFVSSERIFFKIQTARRHFHTTRNTVPYRTYIRDLVSEETCYELGHATNRTVTSFADDPRKGAYIIVNRLQGFDGIPLHVAYKDTLENYPADHIDRAPLLLGSGDNKKLAIKDLASHPHVLVAGSTQGGKSNMVNVMICNFLRFAPADDLKIILIDLKRMEFGYYSEAPHLMRPIIFEADEAVEVLSDLVKEVHRRADLLSNKAKELADWNRKFPKAKLPRIIVIIDELAELMLASGTEVRGNIERLITRITNLGRAVGIHVIVATQRPAVSVLPNSIKINMPLIVAARVPNYTQSNVILGNSEAAKLPIIPGRMLYQAGPDQRTIQTPHILDEDVHESVGIARGRAARLINLDGYEPVLNPDGVAVYIVDCFNGLMTKDNLKRLLAFGVPARALETWALDVVDRGGWKAGKREFKAEKVGNSWRLAEQFTPEVVQVQADDNPPNFTIVRTIPALRRLALPSPVAPPPEPEPPAPEPEPMPPPASPAVEPVAPSEKHPIIMTDDEIFDRFMDECCVKGRKFTVSFADLYKAYLDFCQALDSEITPLPKNKAGRAIKARGYESFQNHGSWYRGLKLFQPAQTAQKQPAAVTATEEANFDITPSYMKEGVNE